MVLAPTSGTQALDEALFPFSDLSCTPLLARAYSLGEMIDQLARPPHPHGPHFFSRTENTLVEGWETFEQAFNMQLDDNGFWAFEDGCRPPPTEFDRDVRRTLEIDLRKRRV